MPQSPSKNLFPLLNLDMVQEFAEKILSHFPYLHATKVTLYKNTPRLAAFLPRYKTTYILVIEVLDLDRYTQQYEELKEYLKPPFNQKLFSLTGDALAGTYFNPPPPEYNHWDEWDFHLVTVNWKNIPSDYITVSKHFVTHAQQSESTAIFSNDKAISLNDKITVNRKLQVLCSRIEYFSNRIEQHDKIEDQYILTKLREKFQHTFHDFIQKSTDLCININKNVLPGDQTKITMDDDFFDASFIDNGNHFIVTYNQITNTYTKKRGFIYLRYILQNKGNEVSHKEILHELNPTPLTEINNINSEDNVEIRNEIDESVGSTPDEKAFEDYKERYLEMEEEIEDARRNKNYVLLEELMKEKEFYDSEFKNLYYTKKYGHINKTEKKIVNTVGKRLNEAIQTILTDNQELGDHLKKNITPHGHIKYRPSPDLHWKFE
ncbi:hypothetical protein Dthio_PD1419 [Desulfonatronospira thiodismutans ASO3-1]|uniref:Uncharacterized protein n=1 Tax=Desulfonatronospira thiodismutans ASO3-1 TaxID=555779 RepID=D6STR3_9BACT|nr:hypothetical protein [Desulfonatronospira thiodismutans]EFI34079.1 hypothetical protein Dthio_PD1419 [Desulfonatronospira thiodismutans ASO3-1]